MVKILYEEEPYMSEEQKFVVTAGRDILGKLAPDLQNTTMTFSLVKFGLTAL